MDKIASMKKGFEDKSIALLFFLFAEFVCVLAIKCGPKSAFKQRIFANFLFKNISFILLLSYVGGLQKPTNFGSLQIVWNFCQILQKNWDKILQLVKVCKSSFIRTYCSILH